MGSLWGQKIDAIGKHIGGHLVGRIVHILILAASIGAIAVSHDLRNSGVRHASIDERSCDVMAHGIDSDGIQASADLEPFQTAGKGIGVQRISHGAGK